VETRQPTSNGADAGTTLAVRYTAAVNDAHPECGGKPQWAGLTCKSYPAATPSSGPPLPTTTTTGFTYALAPTTVVETSGPVTRTTTNAYLPDGRGSAVSTTVTGLTGSTPTTRKETEYDPASGASTKTTARRADGTVTSTASTGYDGWGRLVSYQLSGDAPTTTTYDASGAVAAVTDANGSTRYTYDGPDAVGRTERRGLVTQVQVAAAGSTWTSTGAYDADGGLITSKLPGGITRHTDLDNAGEPVGVRYTGRITTVEDDGTTTVDPDGGWLAWSQDNDVLGRVVREWTPGGSAFTGPAGDEVGDAVPYDREYDYNAADRLVQVRDRTAEGTGVDLTDPAQSPACVTRTYGFDGNDNRITKSTAPAAAGGSCTTVGATTATRAFDTADRPVTGAGGQGSYTYDPLGRTLVLPAADAPNPQAGNVSLGYHDDDLVQSISQGGITTVFTLDALDRRATETVTGPSGSTVTVRHYTDTSDNPTWVSEGGGSRRYAELVGGDLGLTIDGTGAGELTLANPHGDIVTTIALPAAAAPATAVTGWNQYDEYGNPAAANSATTGEVEYGWHGAAQRAVSGAGLTLMGVRVYNPVTGLFTSLDPVDGGGANAYAHPTDPVNVADLDGQKWCGRFCPGKKFKAVMTVVAKVSSYAAYVPGPIGMWGSAISAGAYFAIGENRKALTQLAGLAFGKTAGFLAKRALRPAYVKRFGSRASWTGKTKSTGKHRKWTPRKARHRKGGRHFGPSRGYHHRFYHSGWHRTPRGRVGAFAYFNRQLATAALDLD
jgi:RHS repeat-associated protein